MRQVPTLEMLPRTFGVFGEFRAPASADRTTQPFVCMTSWRCAYGESPVWLGTDLIAIRRSPNRGFGDLLIAIRRLRIWDS